MDGHQPKQFGLFKLPNGDIHQLSSKNAPATRGICF